MTDKRAEFVLTRSIGIVVSGDKMQFVAEHVARDANRDIELRGVGSSDVRALPGLAPTSDDFKYAEREARDWADYKLFKQLDEFAGVEGRAK